MKLVLEIKYPDIADPETILLEEGVYVVGSQAQSTKGQAIAINSRYVQSDHAILECSRRGWSLIALKPQIQRQERGNETLKVQEVVRFGPNSKFTIGDIELRFLLPATKDLVDDEDAESFLKPSLDQFIHKVHIDVTVENQKLIRNEQPDTEDPIYRARVNNIIGTLVKSSVQQIPPQDLLVFAAEAGKRDLVYRIIGGEGIMRPDHHLDITESNCRDFDRIQQSLIEKLAISLSQNKCVSDLLRVNADYIATFAENQTGYDRAIFSTLLRKATAQAIRDLIFGIGPLEYLQEIDAISEIMVVGADKIFIELNGKLVETGLSFVNEESAQTVASYIVGAVGKQINIQNPYEDARLKDGSRVNIVVKPISLEGTALTIRKFGKSPLTLEKLLEFECLSVAMASFLGGCVVSKKNILVSGGTGTGKTTMVNWLASLIPPDERIICVEDVAELQFSIPHVVRMEARPPSADGKGAVTIRDLVRNSLRMRPNRIIVGECRGGEAFDMLQAMNTGHEGSLTTLHANSPVEAISRMENLVLMADQGLPLNAIRFQISDAVDYIIQLKHYPNGKRKIAEISEVGGVDLNTGRVEVNPIFIVDYDHTIEDAETRFQFAGRTPNGIAGIAKGGFDPSLLGI